MKPEELAERLNDTEFVLTQHGKKLEELEQREIKGPEIELPDYSQDFKWIRHALLQCLNSNDTVEIKQRLFGLAEQIRKEPKPVINRYHFSLFPESDAAFYPKILFGKVIPWMMLFVIVGGLFSLGEKGIEAWKVEQYNREAERYVRAWGYLDENGNSKVKKAMRQAWSRVNSR
ncbi:MAG: hypothetical protein ACO1N7_03060 [Sphingobacteriaceae bacterium]